MVFSYSGDAPTAKDKVRLLIADTREKDSDDNLIYVFEDEELETLLAETGNEIYGAAALAIRSRVADLARTATIKIGGQGLGVTMTFDEATKRLMALADKYEEREADNQAASVLDWRDQDVEELQQMRRDVMLDSSTGEDYDFA